MKILSIIKDKYKNRYIIEFENGDSYKISLEQIVKHKLKEDLEIDINYFKDILNEENERETFNKALDIVSLRDHTCFEVKNKLIKKGYEINAIENAIEKLYEYNFVNDEKYATKYFREASKYKKHGKNKIIYTLRQKGISSSIISSLEFDEDLELETAKSLCQKKLKTLKDDEKKKEKIYRYLISRGYSNSVILKVIGSIE